MFDGIEVRNWNRSPHQTDHQRRAQEDAVKAYENAVWDASVPAILERARECRKLRIELVVEDALPVVVALALKGGEHVRYAQSSWVWKARFILDGNPPPARIESDLAAACLDAIGPHTSARYPALRCLGSLIGGRGFEVTSHALQEWGSPGF